MSKQMKFPASPLFLLIALIQVVPASADETGVILARRRQIIEMRKGSKSFDVSLVENKRFTCDTIDATTLKTIRSELTFESGRIYAGKGDRRDLLGYTSSTSTSGHMLRIDSRIPVTLSGTWTDLTCDDGFDDCGGRYNQAFPRLTSTYFLAQKLPDGSSRIFGERILLQVAGKRYYDETLVLPTEYEFSGKPANAMGSVLFKNFYAIGYVECDEVK
jgi:hypothetical protein